VFQINLVGKVQREYFEVSYFIVSDDDNTLMKQQMNTNYVKQILLIRDQNIKFTFLH
jgi:hypothetical protein